MTSQKTKALKLVRQAQGTLERVIKMVEGDQYCPEIIQQVESASGLLRTARRELLSGHLDHCVMQKMQSDKKKAIEELLKIYQLLP